MVMYTVSVARTARDRSATRPERYSARLVFGVATCGAVACGVRFAHSIQRTAQTTVGVGGRSLRAA